MCIIQHSIEGSVISQMSLVASLCGHTHIVYISKVEPHFDGVSQVHITDPELRLANHLGAKMQTTLYLTFLNISNLLLQYTSFL